MFFVLFNVVFLLLLKQKRTKLQICRLAVDMKFPIHMHIHIHIFLRGYPWIYPYP